MSDYSTDASIIAQTSAKITAELVIGGVVNLDEFADNASMVFNTIIGLAGAESLVEILENQSKRGGGGGNYSRKPKASYESDPNLAPSDVVVNFGKFRGQTVGSILDQEPEYVEWLAQNANHADVKTAAAALVASA